MREGREKRGDDRREANEKEKAEVEERQSSKIAGRDGEIECGSGRRVKGELRWEKEKEGDREERERENEASQINQRRDIDQIYIYTDKCKREGGSG